MYTLPFENTAMVENNEKISHHFATKKNIYHFATHVFVERRFNVFGDREIIRRCFFYFFFCFSTLIILFFLAFGGMADVKCGLQFDLYFSVIDFQYNLMH